MKKKNLNFLLYGESTFLNKGCEAIVNSTSKKIRDITDGNIVVATFDIETDKQKYNDIVNKYVKEYYEDEELTEEEQNDINGYNENIDEYDKIEKVKQKDVIKEIDNIDICMAIGGDNYCYGSPNWAYTINKECKKKGKKTVLWSASLFDEIDLPEMIRDLRTYDLIVARETITYKALEKIMGNERLMLAPDTAFSLETKKVDLPEIFNNGKQVVGLNISPLVLNYTEEQEEVYNSFKTLVDYILNETDKNICLIPHVYRKSDNDLDVLKKIKEEYKDDDKIYLLDDRIYDCEEIKYVISNCSELIATRTHASIAGYSTCVPTLVVGYSTKSRGIALDLFGNDKDYVIPVQEVNSENLLEKYKLLDENREKITNILKDKMPEYIEYAQNMMAKTLEKLEELEKNHVTHESQCTGCMACYNACPHNAIELHENDEGFTIPKINMEKCTGCNLCRKVCPMNKNYKNDFKNPKSYAVINKNEKERLNSSSGGVFTLIAKEILKNGGTVYGAELENSHVKHVRIENENELYKIMGSKYVQSEIGTIFKNVEADLIENKEVLFSGTPCQIEGLKSYITKEKQEKLLCISVICHGVPSPKVFEKYVDKNGEIVKFRDKTQGWHKYKINYKNGQSIDFNEDAYMKGFLKDYFLRESCYNCQCKFYEKNNADIILGDFWGIENILPDMDDDKGVSAVIINSKKGEKAFENCWKDCEIEETELKNVVKYNVFSVKPVKYTTNRDEFYELIKNNEIKTSIGFLNGKELKRKAEDNEKIIERLEKDNLELKGYIKDLEEAKEYFINQEKTKEKQIDELSKANDNLNNELQNIYNSKTWRYKNKINKIIRRK